MHFVMAEYICMVHCIATCINSSVLLLAEGPCDLFCTGSISPEKQGLLVGHKDKAKVKLTHMANSNSWGTHVG
jgi:hypothetical protein